MEGRGRKRDYKGRAEDVIRFVKTHPERTYATVGGVFGLTRQAIGHLILGEERRTGIQLHIRQKNTKSPHVEHCRACQRAIKKLQEDPAQTTADLYPGYEHRGYHLGQLRKTGALKGAILFVSRRRLRAYVPGGTGCQPSRLNAATDSVIGLAASINLKVSVPRGDATRNAISVPTGKRILRVTTSSILPDSRFTASG